MDQKTKISPAMAEGPAATTIAASSYEVDLGNLMAYDPSHHIAAASR